jgi:LEA14-like dessication related protein
MKNLIAILFSFALASCQAFTTPVIKKVDSLKFESIENTKVNFDLILSIENLNGFSITGKDLNYSIFYQNVIVGSGKCPNDFELTNNKISSVPAEMVVYLDSIPEKLRLNLFEMDSMPLEIQLGFQGKFGIKHQNQSKFKLPVKMVQDAIIQSYISSSGIKLKELSLISTNASTSQFKGKCTFLNTLPAEILLQSSEIQIYSDNKKTAKVGRLEISDTIAISRNELMEVQCGITVDNIKAIGIGLSKIMTGSLDFYAIGPAKIEMLGKEYNIPIAIHFAYNPMTGSITILEQ